MPTSFEPRINSLPKAQQDIWPLLAPAKHLDFVLYGGTAVALYFGHRVSIDFDFFRSEPLDAAQLTKSLAFMSAGKTIQQDANTLVLLVQMTTGPVKVSFSGCLGIGRLNEPLHAADLTLLVASQEDLLATKLKAILDRAEVKDYLDI